MNFAIIFILLSLANVILSTIKSITTIKSGKIVASVISGAYYAYYNIVVIYMVADYPMWAKCAITGLCNVIGVFVVKAIDEYIGKKNEKLWLVKATIPAEFYEEISKLLSAKNIPYSGLDIICTSGDKKVMVMDTYCHSKADTKAVTEICKIYGGKMFATECERINL